MKQNKTHLIIILDASGSMSPLQDDVIGSYDSLISSQKKEEGECLVTTVTFNTHQTLVEESTPIEKVKPLTTLNYNTSGCTALLDTIGSQIERERTFQKGLKEEDKPEHTIFSIMTDGYENASRKYSYALVKEMIESQKKDGWDFLFQAANIDVAAESHKLGINIEDCGSFDATHDGLMKFCYAANSSISYKRSLPRRQTKK